MDYKNGRIYQIRNTFDDDVYVGSTCQALSKRMAWHRENRKATAKQHRPIYVKMKEYGVECFYIELIEEYPCENKEQLRKREGHFIREIATLNMCQAGRTNREYKLDNHEQILLQGKQYYESHKEQITKYHEKYRLDNKEFRNSKFECACGGSYSYTHKAEHCRCQKHKKDEASLNV